MLQMHTAFRIFREAGVMQTFQLRERQLAHFIANVATNYHPNPYHNLAHVTYVLQTTFLIIAADQQLSEPLLTSLDYLALLLSALCHDIDHDGMPLLLNASLH